MLRENRRTIGVIIRQGMRPRAMLKLVGWLIEALSAVIAFLLEKIGVN